MNLALSLFIAFVMIGGGISHLAAPENFVPLVPKMFPVGPVLFLSGLVELAIGALALVPRLRPWAGLAFAALCVAYLPLHLWDFFRPDPVFAPPAGALVRIAVQLLFIAIGVTLWRRTRPVEASR